MVLTFKCGIHSFETESIDKFDEHYEEGKKKPGAIPCICKECKGKI